MAQKKPNFRKGDTVRIKEQWDKAGSILYVLGPPIFQKQWWIPVGWPDVEDPDFHKSAGLERIL